MRDAWNVLLGWGGNTKCELRKISWKPNNCWIRVISVPNSNICVA